MNRRDFLKMAAASSATAVLLRAGNVEAAEGLGQDAAAKMGLKCYVYNAREYGVKGDGITDDSPAIQALFERANREVGAQLIYFFPAGRYLISEQLRYFQTPWHGDKETINYCDQFIGQGPMLTQFVLKPHAKGYGDPDMPKQVFTMGGFGECFGTVADGFSIIADEHGTNPGSLAFVWQQHFGVSRNLVLSGGHTCYECQGSVAVVMENVTCLGGQYGFAGYAGSYAMKQLRCEGFTKAGVTVCRGVGTLNIHNLLTCGRGPGIKATGNSVVVVNGRAEADPAGQEAAVIDLQGASTLINFETIGYRDMVKDEVVAASGGISSLSFYSGRKHTIPKTLAGGAG